MARPIKLDADWFHHDKGMRNDPRIRAVRRRYGLEGYAVFCIFCEMMTDADGFEIIEDPTFLELTAGDIDMEPEKLHEMVEYFVSIGLLVRGVSDGNNSSILYSARLKRDMSCIIRVRNSHKPGYGQAKYTEESREEQSRLDKTRKEGEKSPPSATPPEDQIPGGLLYVLASERGQPAEEVQRVWTYAIRHGAKPDFIARDYSAWEHKAGKPKKRSRLSEPCACGTRHELSPTQNEAACMVCKKVYSAGRWEDAVPLPENDVVQF